MHTNIETIKKAQTPELFLILKQTLLKMSWL